MNADGLEDLYVDGLAKETRAEEEGRMLTKLSCYALAVGAVALSLWIAYGTPLGGLERLGLGILGGSSAYYFFSLGRD